MATPTLTRAKRDTTTPAPDPADMLVTKYGKLLTVKQAADALSVCTGTVWNMLNQGDLPGLRIPGTSAVRVPASAIQLVDYRTGAAA